MKADPSASTFRVGPVIITAPINVASIALGPRVKTNNQKLIVNEDREVYYCPLSSLHLYSINTSVLRNEMNGLANGEYQGDVTHLGNKGSQTVGEYSVVIIYSLSNNLYLLCITVIIFVNKFFERGHWYSSADF